VKGVLVNIFGGIMRCDVIAEGVVARPEEVGFTCRWSCGSRAPTSRGGKILERERPLRHPATNLADAAQKIVAAVKENA
jgi:succinyl-CoA synthetase beta subunit